MSLVSSIKQKLADVGFNRYFLPSVAPSFKKVISREGLASRQGIGSVARGLYSGAVLPVAELGVRTVVGGPLKSNRLQDQIIQSLRKPTQTPTSYTPTQRAIQQGFGMAGVLAPYDAIENLAIRGVSNIPKVAGLINKGGTASSLAKFGIKRGADIASGQLLASPDQIGGLKGRATQALLDVAIPSAAEGLGLGLKAGTKALKNEYKAYKSLPLEVRQAGFAKLPGKKDALSNEARKYKSADEFVKNIKSEADNYGIKLNVLNRKPLKKEMLAGKYRNNEITIFTKDYNGNPKPIEELQDTFNHEIGHFFDYKRRGIVAGPMGDSIRGYDGKLRPMMDSDIYFRNGPKVNEAQKIRELYPRKDGYSSTQKEIYADAFNLYKKDKTKLKEIAPNIYKDINDFAESDEMFKTKSQLTDIWKEATSSLPTTPKATTPKIPIKDALSNEARTETSSFDTSSYIKKQINLQKKAQATSGLKLKSLSLLGEIKQKFQDFTAPIEDTLTLAEKRSGIKVKPQEDIRLQIDKALRSDTLAGQFVKDNELDQVIRQVDDIDAFDQYLIAKQAGDVEKLGIKTGRNLTEDAKFVQSVSEKYEPLAQKVYKYSRNLLDYITDAGLISNDLSNSLKKKYPNYVPLNRIFSEIESSQLGIGGKSRAVASLGKQSVVKGLEGSERQIDSPIGSILSKTAEAFNQAERNKAAQMLVSYKDLPGNPFALKEVIGGKTPGTATISVLENGKKKIFETTPEVATAAKNLNQQTLGMIGQIIATPTRILKLGATGLNLPFVTANIVKDQVFSAINSTRVASTNMNPANFVRAFFSTLKKDGLYDEWVRSGSSFTSMDIARNQVKPTIEAIRAGRSAGSRLSYTIKHPQSLLRTVEDIIGKSEELTRIQQFNGMKQQLIKEGYSIKDATILAGKASRENTANFGRRGEWGTVLNAAIPYLNAGIQGARSLVRSIKTRPIQTGAKIGITVLLPTTYATIWNISDPQRKAAYDDIPDYEKENNIIILPPNPVQDENGRWNGIKIPLTPGLSNIAAIVRRQIEGVGNFSIQELTKIASDLFATTTSLDISTKNKALSTLTPQALKIPIEGYTNTNLFTGRQIVPEYLKGLPTQAQVKDNTSGTARKIGEALNVSPLKLENAIRTASGGVGQQLLNISDRSMAKAGIIPQEQVGGRGVQEQIGQRFTSVAGGQKQNDLYSLIEKQKKAKQQENEKIKSLIKSGDTSQISGVSPQQLTSLKRSVKEEEAKESLTSTQKALFNLSKENIEKIVTEKPELAKDAEIVLKAKASVSTTSKIKTSLKTTKLKGTKIKSAKKGKKAKSIKVSKASVKSKTRIKFKKPKIAKVSVKIKGGISGAKPTKLKQLALKRNPIG